MREVRHNRWNITYDAITSDDARRMAPDVVAYTINRLRRTLAETQFFLACHGEGMVLPDDLRHEWPDCDYSTDDTTLLGRFLG